MGKKEPSRIKTIYICEDHLLFREGEVSMLAGYADEFKIVGTASNGLIAIEQIAQLQPDIVLLDLNLPEKTGLEVLKELRMVGQIPLVIIITSYNDLTLMRKVKAAGGNAYLLKDAGVEEIIGVIRKVKTRKFINNPEVSFEHDSMSSSDQFKQIVLLTERERDLMAQLVKGVSTSEAASNLFISENTIKNHRKNIYRKLKVSTVQELILYCSHHGLLD